MTRFGLSLLALFICTQGCSGPADVPDAGGQHDAGPECCHREDAGSVERQDGGRVRGVRELEENSGPAAEVVDAVDTVGAGDAVPDVQVEDTSIVSCVPEIGCAEGVCDPEALHCVDCLEDGDCPADFHCVESACNADVCVKGDKECANESTAVHCDEHGANQTFIPCSSGDICAWGDCATPICEPYEKWCTADHHIAVCDGTGTAVQKTLCPPGYACFGDGCAPIRHNIFVIFDTSGSMYDSTPCTELSGPSCEEPWPVCEKKDFPFSLLGHCKAAFHTAFAAQDAEQPRANFVLFRFPQKVTSSAPSCQGGYYVSEDYISGDDKTHVTPDGPDSWFEMNMHQVVSVPFPNGAGQGNLSDCLEWVDFEEVLEPSPEESCSSPVQCNGGACKMHEGNQVCFHHTNPELRAEGWTPLGRTMFYAGEYIRKFVVIDGKPCQVDADCKNANYRCNDDGKCTDVLGHCREHVMLLFTDGAETENPGKSDFFNPAVQAKRFRYGLGCNGPEDCIPDAECTSGFKICEPPGAAGLMSFKDNDGQANLLRDYNGDAIKVTVHVVYAGGGAEVNKEIAANGGGGYYPVEGSNLPELVETLEIVFDIAAKLEACEPAEL